MADSSSNLKVNRTLCFLSVSFHPHSKHLFYIFLVILQRNPSYLALKLELTSFDKLEAMRKELNNKKTELARMQKEIEDRASKLLEKQVMQS